MVVKESNSQPSSYRLKWQKIFDALVQILKTRESQLETLLRERKLLEDNINMQQRIYESDAALLQDRIFQMNGKLMVQDMLRLLDDAKLDLAVGFRKKEGLLCKLKLDQAEGDLADFRECFDMFAGKCVYPQDDSHMNSGDIDKNELLHKNSSLKPRNSAEELQPDLHMLEDEIKRLKLDYDKLLSQKESEVSALLAEKKFVWHQYNIMEGDLSSKLKSKETEVRLANEKIAQLLARMERLQSLNEEKDEELTKLKSKMEEKDVISKKRGEEITRLAHELELMRKKGSASRTPVLSRCTSKTAVSSSRSTNNGNGMVCVTVKKENSVSKVPISANSAKVGSRTLKRKAVDTGLSQDDSPKLFSSSFKVPKLKAKSSLYT